uniref:Uncharacterized protein n=1 Tax=Vitis vinifera TaxID=29760 RepID=F6HIJ4_VITVI
MPNWPCLGFLWHLCKKTTPKNYGQWQEFWWQSKEFQSGQPWKRPQKNLQL